MNERQSSSKLSNTIITLLWSAMLGWSGWASISIIDQKVKSASLEAKFDTIMAGISELKSMRIKTERRTK